MRKGNIWPSCLLFSESTPGTRNVFTCSVCLLFCRNRVKPCYFQHLFPSKLSAIFCCKVAVIEDYSIHAKLYIPCYPAWFSYCQSIPFVRMHQRAVIPEALVKPIDAHVRNLTIKRTCGWVKVSYYCSCFRCCYCCCYCCCCC